MYIFVVLLVKGTIPIPKTFNHTCKHYSYFSMLYDANISGSIIISILSKYMYRKEKKSQYLGL